MSIIFIDKSENSSTENVQMHFLLLTLRLFIIYQLVYKWIRMYFEVSTIFYSLRSTSMLKNKC